MSAYVNWPNAVIIITAGDNVVWKFKVKDADGNVVNIAGWTFGFYSVDHRNASNRIDVTNSGFTITSAADGEAQFVLDRATVVAFAGRKMHGCITRLDSGVEKELTSGDYQIKTTVRPLS